MDCAYLVRFLVKNDRGWYRGSVGYGDRVCGFWGVLVENRRILVGKEFLLKTRGVWALLGEDFWEVRVIFEEKGGF